MKKLLLSAIRILSVVALVVIAALYWFGVNMPIIKKDTPNIATIKQRLHLPEGFQLTTYADRLPGARMLYASAQGHLIVSLAKRGQVVLLEPDNDADGRPDGRRTLLTGLKGPHGIDVFQDWLYIAETGAVGRIRYDQKTGRISGEYQRVVTDIPPGGGHWTRTVKFGPDGMMYVSVGSSCNVCIEKNPKRAALLRYRPDGSEGLIFATGLRNTVGFDWHPVTQALYGVDNGRDLLGDDFPPCELNKIEPGQFYGWPYSNGDNIPDPDYGEGNADKIKRAIKPAHKFSAHNAPLGIKFLSAQNLPGIYRNSALVALHGSWNRSEKDGYKVVSLHFNDDGTIIERDFISGFELDGDVIGRPVDIAEAANGDIFVSDNFTGSIYRVRYQQ